MRRGGVIAVDNVLWSGRVVDDSDNDADTVALREFNDRIVADERVDVVDAADRGRCHLGLQAVTRSGYQDA